MMSEKDKLYRTIRRVFVFGLILIFALLFFNVVSSTRSVFILP